MKHAAAILLLSGVLAAGPSAAGDLCTEWAYHSAGSEARLTERVPGGELCFLANGTEEVSASDTVTLYVLTARNFAGDMDEQVFVRWWDGTMAHWVMGAWVRNVELDAANGFRGQPEEGAVTADLWRIDIPPLVTRPGDNFYAIQLKGYRVDDAEERYLLCRAGGDFSRTNRLGQIWSASEEFDGQDWRVRILPAP